ncbi:MAG TPA: hypothetical protein VM820_08480 [Vicinamibacterales bacterium]|jgi:AcrR family transcriptional regulator|nr:hypothetical protein [Vicinamibacterales bacterium]
MVTKVATTLEQRKAERRSRLLATGIELMGNAENIQISLRPILRHVGLTERYFYESFSSVSAFVVAAYEHASAMFMARLAERSVAAGRIDPHVVRNTVEDYVSMCDLEPELIRTVLVAPLREPALSMRGYELSQQLSEFTQSLSETPTTYNPRVATMGKIGAITWSTIAYLDPRSTVSREEFRDYVMHASLEIYSDDVTS